MRVEEESERTNATLATFSFQRRIFPVIIKKENRLKDMQSQQQQKSTAGGYIFLFGWLGFVISFRFTLDDNALFLFSLIW